LSPLQLNNIVKKRETATDCLGSVSSGRLRISHCVERRLPACLAPQSFVRPGKQRSAQPVQAGSLRSTAAQYSEEFRTAVRGTAELLGERAVMGCKDALDVLALF
jgi:hypothetical protein